MAGKAGSAAEVMQRVAVASALLLERATQTLAEAPAPEDGAAVEKLAKQLKAVTDAGRSAVVLETTCTKATSSEPPPTNANTDSDEMEMDDPDAPTYTLEQVERMRERIERRIVEILGGDESKSAPAGVRSGRPGDDLAPPLRHRGAARAEAA